MKICNTCNESKSLNQFNVSRHDCKDCQKQRHVVHLSQGDNRELNRFRAREYRRITKKGLHKELWNWDEVKARFNPSGSTSS